MTRCGTQPYNEPSLTPATEGADAAAAAISPLPGSVSWPLSFLRRLAQSISGITSFVARFAAPMGIGPKRAANIDSNGEEFE